MLAIETHQLTRQYGKVTAVHDLNLNIEQGSLFGLIGPNGAGKTTTLRMLAGLLEPTSGEIIINGQPIQQDLADLRRQIGFMPDFYGVYEDLVVWEYLDFFGRCYEIPTQRRMQVIDELLELVDLTEKRDAYVHTLSRGMRQRLCLAHAMVHDPQVLLLDEPASGLDPRARVEMRELLRELGAMGKTIILSTHILAELAELCDSIGIIERGQLVVAGRLDAIQKQVQGGRHISIRSLSPYEQIEAFLKNYPGVDQVYLLPTNGESNHEEGLQEIELDYVGSDEAVATLLEAIIQQRLRIVSFNETRTGLEEVFLRLTKGEVA